MKSVSFTLIMRMISTGAAFALNILLARFLGPSDFGQVAYVIAWTALISGLIRAGLNNHVTREVAAYQANNDIGKLHGIINRAYQISWLVSIVAIAGLIGGAWLLGDRVSPDLRDLFLIASPFILMIGLLSVTEAITRGFGNVVAGQIGEFFIRSVTNLGLVLMLLAPLGLDFSKKNVVACYTLSSIAALMTAWLLRPKEKIRSVRNAPAEYHDRAWLTQLIAISALAWISTINVQVTPILIGLLSSDIDVAKYQIAGQFGFLASLMITVVNALQAPQMSRQFSNGDMAGLQKTAYRACGLSTIFAIISTLMFAAFGSQFTSVFLGPDYEGIYAVTAIVLLGTVVNALTGSVGFVLIACRLEKSMQLVVAAAVFANFVLCILLVPTFGAIGGAVASSFSVALWNGLFVYIAYKKAGIVSLPRLSFQTNLRKNSSKK